MGAIRRFLCEAYAGHWWIPKEVSCDPDVSVIELRCRRCGAFDVTTMDRIELRAYRKPSPAEVQQQKRPPWTKRRP